MTETMDPLTHYPSPTTPDEMLDLSASHSVFDAQGAFDEQGVFDAQEMETGSSVINQQELNQLEQLDDAIFGALEGDADFLDQVAAHWRQALAVVDRGLLEESRRQYAQRARAAWKQSQREPAKRLPQGYAALEILGLLDEAL